MLKAGMFPEGHLDDKETCFMLNDVIYHQYLETEKAYLEQIKSEGEKVATNEKIFRYYSSNEENLKQKVAELDEKVQSVMTSDTSLFSSDMKLLENQIDEKVSDINKITDISKLEEYKKEIDNLVQKKAKIAGNLSPKGSYLNQLIEERKKYESQLNSGAEYVSAPMSGIVSYKVDGLEETLTPENFSSLSKEYLENLDLKTARIKKDLIKRSFPSKRNFIESNYAGHTLSPNNR